MSTQSNFAVGREVGVFGRWFRLIVGVYFTLRLTIIPLIQEPVPPSEVATFLGTLGLYFVLIGCVYFIAFHFLRESVLARTNPWVGTIIFLGPLIVITAFDWGPQAFRVALGVYYNISLIINFVMSYGGCEVIAIPILVFRRRYTVYCPYNAVDAVENAMVSRAPDQRIFGVVSILITVLVGSYFLLIETLNMIRDLGVRIDVDNRWALLLLIPIAYLTRNAWIAYQNSHRHMTAEVRSHAIGALVIIVLTVMFAQGLDWGLFWVVAMVVGGVIALIELLRTGPRQTSLHPGRQV